MKSLKGKRVEDTIGLFGTGTVVEHPLRGMGPRFASVLWDRPPPREYNLGHNPAFAVVRELREVQE